MKKYDYYLVITTALILLAVGIVCLYGTAYYNSQEKGWTATQAYQGYLESMDNLIFPLALLLLLALGLCLPKRLIKRQTLLTASIGVLIITISLWDWYQQLSLIVFLSFMLALQGGITILTFLKKGVKYQHENYVAQIGSSLLHLGIVVFITDFALLSNNSLHIPVFWASALLITLGTIMSFYPRKPWKPLKL